MLKKLMQGMDAALEWERKHVRKEINKLLGTDFKAAEEKAEIGIKCDDCNELNTFDSKFCGACGACFVSKLELESGVKCHCGFVNAEGQKFCSECGANQIENV